MNDQTIEQREQELLQKTAEFCEAHLDDDYKKLCARLIKKMAQQQPPAFARGDLNLWAAAIVHALGSMNFLFDKSTQPYVKASDIAAHFNVKSGSVSQKSATVRTMFGLDFFNEEFATKSTKEHQAQLQNMMVQTLSALMPGVPPELIAAEMPRLGPAPKVPGEFVDDYREISDDFYAVAEEAEWSGLTPKIEKRLRALIKRDPTFCDPCLTLSELLLEEGREAESDALLEEAYQRALGLILNDKGEWPRRLEWDWLENRHIIRTLQAKASASWHKGDNDAALPLLRNLLRANPSDQLGLHFVVLAIRLGLTPDDFGEQFMPEGDLLPDIFAWFDQNADKFPEEFAAWRAAVEAEEDEDEDEDEE